MFVFVILSCLYLAALWSPAGKGLTSWLSCLWCFLEFLSLSHMVPWVRCWTWMYWFLIYAFFLLWWQYRHFLMKWSYRRAGTKVETFCAQSGYLRCTIYYYCKFGNFPDNFIFVKALIYILATLKIRDLDMICLHQWTTERFRHFTRVLFTRISASAKFHENKILRKFSNLQYSFAALCTSSAWQLHLRNERDLKYSWFHDHSKN